MGEGAEYGRPQFRFFLPEPEIARYVDHVYASDVPKQFVERIVAVRVPEIEAQLVFAIEEGKTFPGATWVGDGFTASLFLQPPHLGVIPFRAAFAWPLVRLFAPLAYGCCCDGGPATWPRNR